MYGDHWDRWSRYDVDFDTSRGDPRKTPGIRVLLAHPKGWPEERLTSAYAALLPFATAYGATVVTGSDDYHFHHPSARNPEKKGNKAWGAWEREVGAGVNEKGEPHYAAIFVPWEGYGTIGAGTAGIVNAALSAGKPVFAWDQSTGNTRPVSTLVSNPGGGYAAGHRMILSS